MSWSFCCINIVCTKKKIFVVKIVLNNPIKPNFIQFHLIDSKLELLIICPQMILN